MLRAVIFDFDGVIADTEPLHFKAFNIVLAKFGIEITTESYYTDYLGFTDYDCFRFVAEKNSLGLDEKMLNDLIQKKCKVFAELVKNDGGIIEGVCPFLKMLRENNIPLAICSGALLCDIEETLAGAELRQFFETIVAADDVEKGKPHPQGFLLALQRLNELTSQEPIPTDSCIVIEDSRWGLQAARAAEMHTIAVTNSYHADELSMAEKIVSNLSDLSINDLHQLCSKNRI